MKINNRQKLIKSRLCLNLKMEYTFLINGNEIKVQADNLEEAKRKILKEMRNRNYGQN